MNLTKRVLRAVTRRTFAPLERLGLHLLPAHYYSPVPTVSELGPEVYEKRFECVGIDWNLDRQLGMLETLKRYASEFTPAANRGLSLMDAMMLYVMVRERKPAVMIEVGSGASTKIALAALVANAREGRPCQFYAVEPYPSAELRGTPGFTLLDKKLQDVPADLLATADVLFIDSSHVSKIGSDVNYEILEIVPRLKVGTLVHWHDIVMPRNYWPDWIKAGMFWNESYMLHAFMLFNNAFRVQWASQYMQINHFDRLREAFPALTPQHRLTSFWVRREA